MRPLSLLRRLIWLALLLTAPARAAFTDNGDGTVTDTVTGLMWDQCAWGQTWDAGAADGKCAGAGSAPDDYNAAIQDWSTALTRAVTASTAAHRGYRDWRVPNVKELESLVKITVSSPSIDTTAFPNTPSDYFWSSSVYQPDPADAWFVLFYDGDSYPYVQSDNKVFVRLVRSGQSFASFDGLSPCGSGLSLPIGPPALWQPLALPCVPSASPATAGNVLGANTTGQLDAAIYDNGPAGGWVMYGNNVVSNQYNKLAIDGALSNGVGYWLKSLSAPVGGGDLAMSGTAPTAPVTTGDGCASANGCQAIEVTTVAGADRYNLVGNPFPYNVDWAQVRVRVKTSGGSLVGTYTPSQAAGVAVSGNASSPVMSNQIWIYNGTSYETWSDVAPYPGNLKYFKSFWVKVLAAANNYTVELLIPAEASTHSQAEPTTDTRLATAPQPWYLAWLDRLIAPAAADDDFGLAQHPATHPAEHPARALPQAVVPAPAPATGVRTQAVNRPAAQGLVPGREWYVQLWVDEPATGYQDHNSVLGQLLVAKDGYDPRDLAELPPFGKPYLTLAFPHPEWGPQAGDYASDFRAAQRLNQKGRPQPGLPAADWTFTVRADRPGTPVLLRWIGDPAILRRTRLIDPAARKPIRPQDYPDGYPVILTNGTATFTWRYLGQAGVTWARPACCRTPLPIAHERPNPHDTP